MYPLLRNAIIRLLLWLIPAGMVVPVFAQSPASCATLNSRSNSNGQANTCPNVSGTSYASNFAGTLYATVPVLAKTGNFQLTYTGANPSLAPFAVTSVWLTTTGTSLLTVALGPAGVPVVSGGTTQVNYCFYGANLPTAGILSLQLTNPQTGIVWGICSYDASCSSNCSVVATPGILPVAFEYFKAEIVTRSGVRLIWATAQEENNKGFVIERGIGGNAFDSISFIPSFHASGSSSSPSAYSFNDQAVSSASTILYRLRQVSLDGTSTFSEQVAVHLPGLSATEMNAFGQNGSLVVRFPAAPGTAIHDVMIYDATGRLVRRVQVLGPGQPSIGGLANETVYYIKADDRAGNLTSVKTVFVH